ncbi:MAG: EamA family transporter, partial [Kyrpidia sp.]|nr:EamA family transporter [Kyrpidia sp.]
LRGVGVQIWNEPIIGAFLGAAGGFVLYVFTSPVVWRFFQELQRADRIGAGLYAFGGMLTIGAQTCVIAAMRHMPISVANLITLSTPVVVTPVSYFLFRNRERIMVRTVLGLTLVMAGIVFLALR